MIKLFGYNILKDWELKQEMNLRYVALTRAKKELIFVNLTESELIKQNIN